MHAGPSEEKSKKKQKRSFLWKFAFLFNEAALQRECDSHSWRAWTGELEIQVRLYCASKKQMMALLCISSPDMVNLCKYVFGDGGHFHG